MDEEKMSDLVTAIKKHSDLDDEQIIEAGQHGADSGWSGFIYTSDTIAFYDANERLIWELLEDAADGQGVKPLALVSSFRTSVVNVDTFKNLLSWFALEEAGHWLAVRKEEEKERRRT